MFDFVGVTDHHQDEDAYGETGPLRVAEPRPKPHTRTLVTVDADDWIDPTSRAWVNYDEHGNVVFSPPDEVRAADLGARFEGWMMGRDFTPEQERWVHWIEAQIRENAHIFDDFTLDHLEFPPFSLQGGRRRAAELFGGEALLADVVEDLSRSVYGRGQAVH
jgi:type I restriction enzyme R subunit